MQKLSKRDTYTPTNIPHVRSNYGKRIQLNIYKKFPSNKSLEQLKLPHTRKEYAKITWKQSDIVRSIMFLLYDHRIDKIKNFCRKIILSGELL